MPIIILTQFIGPVGFNLDLDNKCLRQFQIKWIMNFKYDKKLKYKYSTIKTILEHLALHYNEQFAFI